MGQCFSTPHTISLRYKVGKIDDQDGLWALTLLFCEILDDKCAFTSSCCGPYSLFFINWLPLNTYIKTCLSDLKVLCTLEVAAAAPSDIHSPKLMVIALKINQSSPHQLWDNYCSCINKATVQASGISKVAKFWLQDFPLYGCPLCFHWPGTAQQRWEADQCKRELIIVGKKYPPQAICQL